MAEGDPRKQSPSEATPLLGHASPPLESRVRLSPIRSFTIISSIGLLLFMQATNMSMMTTAQSAIAADLNAFSHTTWFNAAYMIPMSSVTPLSGRLAQIFTPRLYILFSCVIISIGFFVTAAAPNLSIFLLGRAITGCGGGALTPTVTILTLDLTSKKRRALFFGLISVGMTTGISSGAVLAGLLTPVYGWRIIFWIQAPLSIILGPVQFFAIPASRGDEPEHLQGRSLLQKLAKVDYLGASALSMSVFLLLFSLASPEVAVKPMLLCPIFVIAFLVIESIFASQPIIPVEVFKTRSIMLASLAGLVSMMARWAVLFFSPTYALVVRNWSPASAGLILVPTNVGFGLGGVLVGWIHIRKTGSYYISSLVMFLLFGLSNIVLAVLSTPNSPTLAYVLATFLNGLSIGALLNYSLSHLLHLTNPNMHYIITAVLGMSRGFAGSFGSAVSGGFFQRKLKQGLETGFAEHGLFNKDELIRKLLGSPALVESLTGVEKSVAIRSYENAVKMLLLGGSVLALFAMMAQAGTGWTPYADAGKEADVEEIVARED